MARVVQLYLRPSSRTPVRPVTRVEAVAGRGLEGDHARGGNRQVTLMEIERWQAACRHLGRGDLDPGGRRANIVVEGLPLAAAIGRKLRVGESIVEVVRRNPPCKLLEDVATGLMQALAPECRSGVYGRVLQGGRIEIDSQVVLLPIGDERG